MRTVRMSLWRSSRDGRVELHSVALGGRMIELHYTTVVFNAVSLLYPGRSGLFRLS